MNNSDPSGMWTVYGQINQMFTPSGAESWLASLYPNGVPQVTFETTTLGFGGNRRVDVYNRSNGGWLNEIKTGSYSNNTKTKTQCKKDAALVNAGEGNAVGGGLEGSTPISGATWWFVPNTNGTTNPSDPLVDSLAENGINLVILNYNSESDNSLYSSAYGSLANLHCSSAISTVNVAQSVITAEGAAITSSNATLAGIHAAGEADLQALPYLSDLAA